MNALQRYTYRPVLEAENKPTCLLILDNRNQAPQKEFLNLFISTLSSTLYFITGVNSKNKNTLYINYARVNSLYIFVGYVENVMGIRIFD
jgi:hypothetical protein